MLSGKDVKRKQFLRNIKACAATIMTINQAAKLLGFNDGQELRELRRKTRSKNNINPSPLSPVHYGKRRTFILNYK